MPIKPGYSYSRVQENIAQLITEGYMRSQATAIAFSVARKAYWSRHPEGALPEWLTPATGQRMQTTRKQNPVPISRKVQIRNAAELYENFSGHDAEEIISIDKPVMPDVMLAVGEIDGVMYSTVRDGVAEKYIHKFKKSCRPIFAVSHDGKQLYMIGGSYDFTERGIVDNTKEK